jgi:hypothetical protein
LEKEPKISQQKRFSLYPLGDFFEPFKPKQAKKVDLGSKNSKKTNLKNFGYFRK